MTPSIMDGHYGRLVAKATSILTPTEILQERAQAYALDEVPHHNSAPVRDKAGRVGEMLAVSYL